MNENEIAKMKLKIEEYENIIDGMLNIDLYETQSREVVNTIYDKIDGLKKEMSDFENKI